MDSAADTSGNTSELPVLGAGAQFTTHDLGDGRVLKLPNTLARAQEVIMTWQADARLSTLDARLLHGRRPA